MSIVGMQKCWNKRISWRKAMLEKRLSVGPSKTCAAVRVRKTHWSFHVLKGIIGLFLL